MDLIGTETAFEAAARARALEANVREAAKRALDAGATRDAPFPGIPDLRAAIAENFSARRGMAIAPDRVFVRE